jgi:hypothetical protein
MRQRGITEALTGDHHFEQAGFVALLTRIIHGSPRCAVNCVLGAGDHN